MKADLAVGLSVALITAAVGWWYRRKNEKIPTDWLEVGQVEELLVYPLKSGAPIVCNQFECTPAGPVFCDSRDRVLAVVDENGSLITGRDSPLLTQVIAEVKGTLLTLSADQQPSLTVDLSFNALEAQKKQPLQIWKCNTEGVDCGDLAAAWVSKYLNKPTRVLYFPEQTKGKSVFTGFLDLPFIRREDGGVFSDAMSYLIVNKTSVHELNTRVESAVSSRIFRPNIVISGEKLHPYEEDSWEWVKVGDVVFRLLAPCTRCLFTTVDPDTGVKSESFEPLKTLRRFRVLRDPEAKKRFGSSPVMGQYLGLRSPGGVISTGDIVSVPIKKV